MRPYELPLIEEGTAEEQLKQIKSFLYRQAENLNYNLKNSDVTSLWRQTAEALSVASNEEVEQMRRDEFQALRGLIIKSATSIIKNEDSFSAHFAGDYTAESDYGTFTEEGNIFINGNPYTIGQIYKYQAQIVTDVSKYKTDMEGFIKTGVLERETSNPVFGMEIGYNKNTYTVDGVVHENEAPAKIRITPVKIGFYQGDDEVAYIKNSAIYFPAAHITGGSIQIGLNKEFTVDDNGNLVARSAVIEGTVHAKSGFIGGFETRGASSSEGRFWPCSISSILTPSDGEADDDYEYVVFMRGNYTENGDNYGAITTTHNVFGIKKRAINVTSWDNEEAPYVYRVTVKGEVTCASVTTGNIEGSYIKANSDNVLIGNTSYEKPIYIYTSNEIRIGTYRNKASNIYLLASGTVRIGQHSEASTLGGTDYPSTTNVLIQASTLFQVGGNGYAVNKAYIYANSTQFSDVIAPISNEGADLGHSDYKWKHIYSKYLTVNTSGCDIGGDTYARPINIKTSGELTFKGLVGSKVETYTFGRICEQINANRENANTAVSTANTANATANTAKSTANTAKSTADTNTSSIKSLNSNLDQLKNSFNGHGTRIGKCETDIFNLQTADNVIYNQVAINADAINKIKQHLGLQ